MDSCILRGGVGERLSVEAWEDAFLMACSRTRGGAGRASVIQHRRDGRGMPAKERGGWNCGGRANRMGGWMGRGCPTIVAEGAIIRTHGAHFDSTSMPPRYRVEFIWTSCSFYFELTPILSWARFLFVSLSMCYVVVVLLRCSFRVAVCSLRCCCCLDSFRVFVLL